MRRLFTENLKDLKPNQNLWIIAIRDRDKTLEIRFLDDNISVKNYVGHIHQNIGKPGENEETLRTKAVYLATVEEEDMPEFLIEILSS
jgi:hypothetical protein